MKTKTKKILFITCMLLMTSLIIIQMMFIWAIDVSTGAIWRDNILNNGFGTFDPITIYHVGLFGVIIITGLLFMIVMIMLFTRFSRIKDISAKVEETYQKAET